MTAAKLPAQVCEGFLKQPLGALGLFVVDVEFSKVFRRPNRLFALITLNPLKSFFCSRQHRQSLVAPHLPVEFSDQERSRKVSRSRPNPWFCASRSGPDRPSRASAHRPALTCAFQAEHRRMRLRGHPPQYRTAQTERAFAGGCPPGRRDRVQDTTVRSSGGSMPQRGDDSRTARQSRRRGQTVRTLNSGSGIRQRSLLVYTGLREEIIPDEVIDRLVQRSTSIRARSRCFRVSASARIDRIAGPLCSRKFPGPN